LHAGGRDIPSKCGYIRGYDFGPQERTRMSLSNFAITRARAKDKPIKLSDGDGLHLLVKPGGSKLWRFRYRFADRENMLAFGAYPSVSLAEARSKREEARRLLADGKDPSVKKKLDKIAAATAAQNTFGAVA